MFFFGIVVAILLPYQAFGFNLLEEISLKVQSMYDGGAFNEYLNRSYNSEFSKDPFGDAMSDISDMSSKLKKSGEDYVKKSLDFDGCSLSNKEIRGILYHHVPEYQTDIARSLKIEQGKYDSRDYMIDPETVEKEYCAKFSKCVDHGPANMETNCKEFFQKNYKAGEYNELMKQNVQVSRLGSDKYWNNTTDDSPYDIIEDLGVLSKLLYMQAEDPIKPVFYDIPAFSNSKDEASENMLLNNGISSNNGGENERSGFGGNRTLNGGEGQDNQINQRNDGDNGGDRGKLSERTAIPLGSRDGLDYDALLEGLGAYKLTSDGSEFYTDLCDNREDAESEIEDDSDDKAELEDESLDIDDISDEEYQVVVDYMLNVVDSYSALPPEKLNEIQEKYGDKSDFGSESSDKDLQERAEGIKDCWGSCTGLRYDQMASCMIKCTCGEITSADDGMFGMENKFKLFDPSEFPGLGPVLIIRFCAVPAVDMRFSVGGKRIHSIEEGLREIYGVVDKLSREGRLGAWTQQYEFLDASTKRINFADITSFSLDVEFVNIGNRTSKHSKQYEEKKSKNDDKAAQENYKVSNELNTTRGRNHYKILSDENSSNLDSVNGNDNAQTRADLQAGSTFSTDVNEGTTAVRYTQIESYWDLWLEQQGELWVNIDKSIDNLGNSAQKLNGWKKKCKK